MEVQASIPHVSVQTAPTSVQPELDPIESAEVSAHEAIKETPSILPGPGVRVAIAQGDSLVDQLAALRNVASPDQAAVLSNMMKGYFDTMMNTANNMAPSEEELELRERRKEELEQLIQDLEAKKITVEDALTRFENTCLAAADKELLEVNMAKQRPTMA